MDPIRPIRTYKDSPIATDIEFNDIIKRAMTQTGASLDKVQFDVSAHKGFNMLEFLSPLFSDASRKAFFRRYSISREDIKDGLIGISKASALVVKSLLFSRLCSFYSYNHRSHESNIEHPVVGLLKDLVRQMNQNLVSSHKGEFESLVSEDGNVDLRSKQLESLVIILNSGNAFVDPQQVLRMRCILKGKLLCITSVYYGSAGAW